MAGSTGHGGLDRTRGTTISDLLQRLRAREWRLTPQRRVVAEVLRGEHVHLSAEEVYERARAVLPEISLATVYNTLHELTAMGEVFAVEAGGGPRRFDPNVDAPHHHLACIGCGLLRDVEPTPIAEPAEERRHGFALTGVRVVFEGRCPSCATAGSGDGPGGVSDLRRALPASP